MDLFGLEEEVFVTLQIPAVGVEGEYQSYKLDARRLNDAFQPGDVKPEGLFKPEYKFPDHHPSDAVALALLIIGDPFISNANVPEALDVKSLYHLLKFTRALNLTRITNRWAKMWAAAINLSVIGASGVTSERLFVAWELGDRDSFDQMVTWMALNVKKPNGSNVQEALKTSDCFKGIAGILNARGEPISHMLAAPEDISEVRREAINLIYKTINDDMQALFSGGSSREPGVRPCHATKNQQNCEETLAGSLSTLLYKCKLWPPVLVRPVAANQWKSVSIMREEIRGVMSHHNEVVDWLPDSKNPRCGMKLPLFANLESQIKQLSVLSRRHFDSHFRRQGQRTGFAAARTGFAVAPPEVIDLIDSDQAFGRARE